MMEREKETEQKLLEVIDGISPKKEGGWVNLTKVTVPLREAGVEVPKHSLLKIIEIFARSPECPDGVVELREERLNAASVYYVRRAVEDRTGENNAEHSTETAMQDDQTVLLGSTKIRAADEGERCNSEKGYMNKRGLCEPSADTNLLDWAWIPQIDEKYQDLAELALPENWYYGDKDPGRYPVLRNYLRYTFQRLCTEKKVLTQIDQKRFGTEYAAFNTGLVDKRYRDIYALFRKDQENHRQYWYFVEFAVAGENAAGKTLVRLFNPLPKRADYFENKIENMLYDPSKGDLTIDYEHIIRERISRLPKELLFESCTEDFLTINGLTLREAAKADFVEAPRSDREYRCKLYYKNLGEKVWEDKQISKRLMNRIQDAVDITLKRVEWNYKTAIPVYYPKVKSGALLLPLAIIDEDHVDLALVVEWMQSGAYQGHTVLPLDIAYSDSRLVTRPDSDWLRPEQIVAEEVDEDR